MSNNFLPGFIEWFLCPDGFAVVSFPWGDEVTVTMAVTVVDDSLVWVPVVDDCVVPFSCEVGTTGAWVLFEEGITVPFEGSFVGMLGGIADVRAGVPVVDEVLMLPPPAAAPEIIIRGFHILFTNAFLAQGKQLGKLQNWLLSLAAKTEWQMRVTNKLHS